MRPGRHGKIARESRRWASNRGSRAAFQRWGLRRHHYKQRRKPGQLFKVELHFHRWPPHRTGGADYHWRTREHFAMCAIAQS